MWIDIGVIGIYFLVVLAVGLWIGRQVTQVDDYMVGGRQYRAPVIFATLSAGFIGGGFTTGLAEKVFTMGLVYVVGLWGFSVKEILVAKYLAPRMNAFRSARSVGDMMGQLYGKKVKIFTGFAAVLVSVGIAGAQFAAFGYILQVLLDIEPVYGILCGVIVVVSYATLGGMKSVVANDVIHFCVLIIALPLVCLFGLSKAGGIDKVLISVPTDHASWMGQLSLLAVLGLFLNFFFGETLVPPYVQRLLIGKNAKETAKGTLWSGLLSFPFFLMVGLIGLTVWVLEPTLDPNLALPYAIKTVMPVGLKGLAIAGLLAVLMSSSDCFLNAAAISMIEDVINPLKKIPFEPQSELLCARLVTVVVGCFAALFALSAKSAIDILLLAYNFWTPFILVPLAAGILGYHAKASVFWWSAVGGILATCFWEFQIQDSLFNGAIIGIVVNAIIYFGLSQSQSLFDKQFVELQKNLDRDQDNNIPL